jgi:hypothetical protein
VKNAERDPREALEGNCAKLDDWIDCVDANSFIASYPFVA